MSEFAYIPKYLRLAFTAKCIYYRLNDMLCETYDDRWATEMNIELDLKMH
jgi:hypothetical protein